MVEKSDSERQHKEKKKREKANETKTNDSKLKKHEGEADSFYTLLQQSSLCMMTLHNFICKVIRVILRMMFSTVELSFVAFGSVKPVTAAGANPGFLL